jgi:hypothetical protein
MTRCRSWAARIIDLSLVALGQFLARPSVGLVAVLAICLGPVVSLASLPGLARAPGAEFATISMQVTACAGVGCGLWLAVEHAWSLRLLARWPRLAIEWCVVAGTGAACALLAAAVGFALSAHSSWIAVGWSVWVHSALALLLVRLQWRSQTTVFAFVVLAWVLPAAIPTPVGGHRALDFAYQIAQDLSPAAASSDKTALNLFDLAPSAALLVMACLLSQSGRR